MFGESCRQSPQTLSSSVRETSRLRDIDFEGQGPPPVAAADTRPIVAVRTTSIGDIGAPATGTHQSHSAVWITRRVCRLPC